MEVTELMVGDWVYQDVPEQPYFQIEDFYDIGDADDFDPIPITPEILEKNGFKVYTIDEVTFCKSENVTINMSGKSIWLHIEIFGCTLSHYDIKYIHELQHALRLCKIDKEIEYE